MGFRTGKGRGVQPGLELPLWGALHDADGEGPKKKAGHE